MGTMSASFVQPRTQIRGQSSSSSLVHQNSFTNASENGERSGLTSASIIPESFRRSLDFSIDVSREQHFSRLYVFYLRIVAKCKVEKFIFNTSF